VGAEPTATHADALIENTAAAMVADDPYLLLEILERVQVDVRMH
jgi:hypothetical protein